MDALYINKDEKNIVTQQRTINEISQRYASQCIYDDSTCALRRAISLDKVMNDLGQNCHTWSAKENFKRGTRTDQYVCVSF